MISTNLLIAAVLMAGQADAPAEQMKIFQPLIGQWVHVGPVQSESLSLGQKGEEFIAVMNYTWAIDKNALLIRWSGKSAGNKPILFVELVGWDGKQKKLVSQGFANVGSVEHNVWTREGNVIICHTQGVNEHGEDLALKYLHEIDGDIMTFKEVEIAVDGEEKAAKTYRYRRVR